MIADRPLLGIVLMLCFCLLAPLADAVAKLLGPQVALIVLVATRFVIQVAVLLPIAVASGIALRISPRVWRLTALRTVLHVVGIALMFLSLRYLPLADAIAIAFVMPFILLLLGRFLLNEEVGSRRLVACAVGFCGTLLVVQPAFAEIGPAALLPLAVAVNFAFFMLVTRQVARAADPIALQAISGLMATVVLVPVAWLVVGQDATSQIAASWTLLLALGVLGTGAHLLMTWSLRFAPGATVAPMQYLEIPVATFYGWAIFGDLPDRIAALGIAITILAGLYVVLREHRLSRIPAPPAPHPAPAVGE